MTNKTATTKQTTATKADKATSKPAVVSSWIDTLITASLKQVNAPVLTDANKAALSTKLANLYLQPADKCSLLGCNKQALAQVLVIISMALGKPAVCKHSLKALALSGVYYNDAGLLVKQALNAGNVLYLDKAGQKKSANFDWLLSVDKQLKTKPDFVAQVIGIYCTDNKDVTRQQLTTAISALIGKTKALQSYASITAAVKAIKTA